MPGSTFIEDIFIEFVDYNTLQGIGLSSADSLTCWSFYTTCTNNNPLTKAQANLILKLLNKYKQSAKSAGLDYSEHLVNPQWKNPFRVIDLTKKVWIESKDNEPIVYMKFPYQLKKEFDEEFNNGKNTYWDSSKKVRELPLYKFNLIQIHEFALKYEFEIDDSFESVLGEVEEIWQRSDSLIPRSTIVENNVQLINASDEVCQWWNEHKTNNISSDLLLAKSMGYPLELIPSSPIEKIAASPEKIFSIKSIKEFLNLCNLIDGKICIVLDRSGSPFDWLKEFAHELKQSDFNSEDVKICFRTGKHESPDLNNWIKENGFGGKVESGKLLIFNHKPAKWLFKEAENVKIVATNNLYQPTNTITRDWFSVHSCVVYLGDIKPSLSKDHKIVEL